MPLLPYTNRLEPVGDAPIWRYLDLRKFRDLPVNCAMVGSSSLLISVRSSNAFATRSICCCTSGFERNLIASSFQKAL
jgi:hypothetical protein